MIKAKLNNGDLLFGLSKINIQKLQEGKPIIVKGKDMNLNFDVVITFGETEEDIYRELMPLIDIDKTKIHI